MEKSAQLQFALIAPEAQRAAVRRLALRGLDDEEIAALTGFTSGRIREMLSPPDDIIVSPALVFRHWRSGSSGGPARA